VSAEKKSHAWNRYQAEQAALLRDEVAQYVIARGVKGCGIQEVMAHFAISYDRAQYALIQSRKIGLLELNGLRASELRWGPVGIKAHTDDLMVERRAKAAEKRRERNRRYQAIREQTRIRTKESQQKRNRHTSLSAVETLVQRVPASVWDYAQR
jgi:hypothetical protein